MPEFEQRRPICAGAMARGRGQKQPGMDWMAAAEARLEEQEKAGGPRRGAEPREREPSPPARRPAAPPVESDDELEAGAPTEAELEAEILSLQHALDSEELAGRVRTKTGRQEQRLDSTVASLQARRQGATFLTEAPGAQEPREQYPNYNHEVARKRLEDSERDAAEPEASATERRRRVGVLS